jgi:hypothetical protein
MDVAVECQLALALAEQAGHIEPLFVALPDFALGGLSASPCLQFQTPHSEPRYLSVVAKHQRSEVQLVSLVAAENLAEPSSSKWKQLN